MKRKIGFATIAVIFLLTGAMAGSAAALDEIRIGTIGPITGWATIFGQGCLNGINLALEEHGNAFNGIPIKVFSEDTKADVEVMRTKLDSLKNRDKVHLIIGPSLGHEGMAAVDWGARNPEVPMLIGYSAPEDITMRKATDSVIRPGWTGAQVIFNFGQHLQKDTVCSHQTQKPVQFRRQVFGRKRVEGLNARKVQIFAQWHAPGILQLLFKVGQIV